MKDYAARVDGEQAHGRTGAVGTGGGVQVQMLRDWHCGRFGGETNRSSGRHKCSSRTGRMMTRKR